MVGAGRGRRHVGLLLFAVFCVAGLVALGTWQLDRLAQKEALIADRQAMLVLPPLDLTRDKDHTAATAYRRVTVSGRFLHAKELRMGPRVHHGNAGWKVITPLVRGDGGIVLVDRGWVPDSGKDPKTRQDGQVDGSVRLTGLVKTVSVRGPFVPDNDPAKGDWYWVDPVSMAAHLKLSGVAPYWIVADRDAGRQVGPTGADQVAMPANKHLGYAMTWYALAVSLVVLTLVYWRRASSSDNGDGA